MPTNSTSLCGDYHTAHARGTIKSWNIIEFPFFFFTFIFKTSEAASEGPAPCCPRLWLPGPCQGAVLDAAGQQEQQMLALGMEEGEGPWAQAGCWDRHVQAAGGKCLSQLRIQAAATSGCEMEQILWPSPLCYFLSVFGIKKLDLYCTKH